MPTPAPTTPTARPLAVARNVLNATPGARAILAGAVAASALAVGALIAGAFALATAVDRVFLGHADLPAVVPDLMLALVALVSRALLEGAAGDLASRLARRVRVALRERLVEQLFRLGPASRGATEAGALVATVLESVDALAVFVSVYLPRLALAVIVPLLVLVAVADAYPLAGLVLLATAPLVPFFMVLVGKAAEARTWREWQALYRLNAHFLDLVKGLTTLAVLGRAQALTQSVGEASEAYRRRVLGTVRVALLSALVLEGFASLATALVAVVVGLALVDGRVAFRPALAALLLVPEFYAPQRELGSAFHKALSGLSAAAEVFRLLALEPPIRMGELRLPPPEGPLLLTCDRVRFAYPGREAPVLSDVSFTLRPGERLAVVGPSGAGKSTLLHLVLGYLVPTAGEIRVGDRPLTALDPDLWRARIAYVPQTPYLTAGTLAENLRLANPEAGADELWWALEEAGLADFVRRLPRGLDTPVGDRGLGLSGGQVGRLALARAFLRRAPLVLLDEPTAHLDPRLRDEVLGALDRHLAGRTVILATHRPWEAALAERRLVLERPGDLGAEGAAR